MNHYWFGEEHDPVTVMSLLSACYERPYDTEYVKWLGQQGRWFVAYNGYRPVGCYGIASVVFETEGVLIDVGLVNNAGVVRRHRGGSLFADLGAYALGKYNASAYLGVSNGAALKGHLKVGWTHSHDVAMCEGAIPSDGSFDWGDDDHGARHARGWRWSDWRFSKPGEKYYKTEGGVVFKIHNGVRQIVMSGHAGDVDVFGSGALVGLMVRADGELRQRLTVCGFRDRFRRHVVVKGALAGCMPPRIEPCDYDVL